MDFPLQFVTQTKYAGIKFMLTATEETLIANYSSTKLNLKLDVSPIRDYEVSAKIMNSS